MTKSFPQNFDLRFFNGPRAQQFTKPEDAFQQLLGDTLKEMAGPYAHISPTRGRDGSIDAFLIEGAILTGPFRNLSLPMIVECKTHEDAVKDLSRNILGQWAMMEKKLEAHASDGWKGLFEPWLAARSYAYCVSSQIPNEQTRQMLNSAIEAFFTSLPDDCRPPIDSIRVVDWNDLRQWFESYPRVSDSWLGIEFELILDHETYLNSLSGFREYLLPSKLEFVPPPSESLFHPATLFAEIENPESRLEALLVGLGGIGKTRTAIEVGTLAVNAGWRVLHILPDDPGVETEHIAEIVLPYLNSRTLLVFDYVDQMQKLDLGSIRRSLIPSALKRGIQLRLLANCRPGWLQLTNPARDELFRVVELKPADAHKRTLIETMASRIAPTASQIIGKHEVTRLCGTRAIMALLIARELENRALANLLRDIDTATFRAGDLVQWLRRRLQENSLSVSHEELSLAPQRPEIPMVAAAAALACAPETHATLVLASESSYRNLQWPTASEDARFLVDLLLKFGWLENHGLFASTPHDVVADEVLEQTIHAEAVAFERELTAVLSCVFTIPRGIGRLATALRRVLGSMKSEEAVRGITDFLQTWLKTNAKTLGEVLQKGDPDITGYALGALLSGPPWEEAAIERWNELFLPWLHAHSTKEEARHLLYKGLKRVQAPEVDLVTLALTWLTAHNLVLSASFVIGPLLHRAGTSIIDATQIIRLGLSWLEQHHTTLDAGFVLPALLERQDLSDTDAAKSKRFALLWLDQHHRTLDARFMLPPLLERQDLSDADAEQAERFALLWLEQHHRTLDGGFVLPPLLERQDLSDIDAAQAKRFAFVWLGQYHSTHEARFVLKPFLERRDLSDSEAAQAQQFALVWLEQHPTTLDARFVLPPLLERQDLSDTDATQAQQFTLLWLELHHRTLDARFVLPPLLERQDLSDAGAAQAKRFALVWLEQNHSTLDAGFVLKPLLERQDLSGADAAQAKRFTLIWFEHHHLTLDARFVLEPLLERQDLSDEDAAQAKRFALLWLEHYHSTLDARFVLPVVLEIEMERDDAAAVVQYAVNWLRTFYGTTDAEFVLRKLFRRDGVPQPDQVALMRAAIQRSRERLGNDDTSFLLRSCLQYRINNDALQQELVTLAIEWLELHTNNPDGEYLWNRVLRYPRNLISDQDWSRVVKHAISWLRTKSTSDVGVEQTTNSVLMRQQCLDALELRYVVELALELLKISLHPQGRRKLISSLKYVIPMLPDDNSLKHQIINALEDSPLGGTVPDNK